MSPSNPTTAESVQFDANASIDDGSIAICSWEFGDGTTGSGETATHQYGSAGGYDVTLTVTDDDGATEAATQTVMVASSGDTTYDPGHVFHRVNAGGDALSATDDGPDWAADPSGSPSQYLVSGNTQTNDFCCLDGTTDAVPSHVPLPDIYLSGREDQAGGDDMQYSFDVADGETVEVRLHIVNQHSDTNAPGDRVFDVSVEGRTVLDDYDVVADAGHDMGTMKSFVVTSDGTVDVSFGHGTDLPFVSGIEVIEVDDSSGSS